jgi:RNA-directed DNA polymerase
MQAIVKMALEAEWEQRFEQHSYGFRPGRCTMDAITAIHQTVRIKGSAEWILDADISACFDRIDHTALLSNIPVFKKTIRKWLKAGVVELGHYNHTETGTPQGGIISPLLANIALHGMAQLFGAQTKSGTYLQPQRRSGINKGLQVIRYADDFVVTAPSREILEQYVVPKLRAFLAERGLELSQLKTRIVQIDEGFDFLGFTIRRFNKTVLTKPQKEKLKVHLERIKTYLRHNQQAPTIRVIQTLNPIIRGWCLYYQYGASSRTFRKANHHLWQALWRWAKRRHPIKAAKWVKAKYFRNDGLWTFHVDKFNLLHHHQFRMKRFTKVKGNASPLDPELKTYWAERRKQLVKFEVSSSVRYKLLEQQEFRCEQCGLAFAEGQPLDVHHKIPKRLGGTDKLENLSLQHSWCHQAYHQRVGYKSGEI